MLTLKSNARDEIFRHAGSEYPNECCGVLLGEKKKENRIAEEAVRMRNIAEGLEKRTHFLINPLELIRIERCAAEGNLEIVGFYHSHPGCEAIASKEDVEYMLPGYSYSIVSVKNGKCAEINSFIKRMGEAAVVTEEQIIYG